MNWSPIPIHCCVNFHLRKRCDLFSRFLVGEYLELQIKTTMQLLYPTARLTILSVGKDVATGALISWVWVCAMEQSLFRSIGSN